MASNDLWFFDLESKIATIVKTKVKKAIGEDYPNLNFTTTDLPSETTTKYPTVYIHETACTENGMDILNDSINAVTYGMQVEVVTNQSQKEAKDVMKQVALIFKELNFNITEMPTFDNGTTYYHSIMRVMRVIGADDGF